MLAPMPTTSQTAEGLKREIRRWDIVALVVNMTVGAGIFRLPSQIQAQAGNYSLPAYLVCAAIMALIVLCFAEVASRFTETGGPYLYCREAFGPAPAFMVGWLMWLTRLTGFATLADVLVVNLAYFWPGAGSGTGRVVVISIVTLLLTALNSIGVRQSAIAGDFLTL